MGSKLKIGALAFILSAFSFSVEGAEKIKYVEPVKPFSKNFSKTSKGAVEYSNKTVVVPFITWAGDGPVIVSNGGENPNDSSFFSKNYGFKVQLKNGDDFSAQVHDYISGKSPFIRGTLGMLNLAAETLSSDSDLTPKVFVKMSWSEGADGLVVKSHIKSSRDLKGKTIALQQNSPHLEFLEQILRDSGLSTKDVTLKFVEQIIEAPGVAGGLSDPANAFRHDSSIDAAFCIAPDTLNLTGGGQVGTGAEGSVKGAYLLVTTRTANRVIADCLAVRSDFLNAHKEVVEGLAAGIFNGMDLLKKGSDKNDGYASIASKVLLKDENPLEFKSMLSDVNLSDQNENGYFFEKEGNPVGFQILNKKYQMYLAKNGYTAKEVSLAHFLPGSTGFKGVAKAEKVERKTQFSSTKEAQKVFDSKKAGSGVLYSYTFQFKPNETKFHPEEYQDIFKRIHELAETYGGALVQIIGHGDPTLANKMMEEGQSKAKIQTVLLSSKRMTLRRSIGVKKALIEFAQSKDLIVDETQFLPNGKGIESPLFAKPSSEKEWMENMRVEVQVVNIESEASSFGGK